ncbi:MAG TPA: DUF4177 domain-containing protein [Segetibacter sp.]
MNKFEYKVLDVPAKGVWFGGKIDHQELSDKLNELGTQGWEVVSMSNTNMINNASRGITIILKRSPLR